MVLADQFEVSWTVATAFVYRDFVVDMQLFTTTSLALAAISIAFAHIFADDFHTPVVVVAYARTQGKSNQMG